MLLGWETFSYIQLGGFIVLLIGMCTYNDVLFRPAILKMRYSEDTEAIMNDGGDEEEPQEIIS